MKTDTRVADGTTRSIPPIISTLSAPTFSFLYSEQFSEDFHLAALHDMCRVAKEVRRSVRCGFESLLCRHAWNGTCHEGCRSCACLGLPQSPS
jgi:hypothetical protein